jgi:hypothetical protein
VFCERCWSALPLPLTDADRAAGYWGDIAMRQGRVLEIIGRSESTRRETPLGVR